VTIFRTEDHVEKDLQPIVFAICGPKCVTWGSGPNEYAQMGLNRLPSPPILFFGESKVKITGAATRMPRIIDPKELVARPSSREIIYPMTTASRPMVKVRRTRMKKSSKKSQPGIKSP
jgi:hypothetical protein